MPDTVFRLVFCVPDVADQVTAVEAAARLLARPGLTVELAKCGRAA
ncbi:hypothetical protein CCP1ISM_2130001 [Azospirillaceae bacterium]